MVQEVGESGPRSTIASQIRQHEVETATAGWVAWFDHDRLHNERGPCTAIEIGMAFIRQPAQPRQAA